MKIHVVEWAHYEYSDTSWGSICAFDTKDAAHAFVAKLQAAIVARLESDDDDFDYDTYSAENMEWANGIFGDEYMRPNMLRDLEFTVKAFTINKEIEV